jgi:hypothetical protein
MIHFEGNESGFRRTVCCLIRGLWRAHFFVSALLDRYFAALHSAVVELLKNCAKSKRRILARDFLG